MAERERKIEPPAQRASRLRIEREAVSESFCDFTHRSTPWSATEAEIEHSKAISAKRQADCLERIAKQIEAVVNWIGPEAANLRVQQK